MCHVELLDAYAEVILNFMRMVKVYPVLVGSRELPAPNTDHLSQEQTHSECQ